MLIAAHDKVRMCNILLMTLATIKYQFFRRGTIHTEKKPVSFVISVRLSLCINSAPTTKICIKYDIGGFRETV
jgi:hypothetical protein